MFVSDDVVVILLLPDRSDAIPIDAAYSFSNGSLIPMHYPAKRRKLYVAFYELQNAVNMVRHNYESIQFNAWPF